MSPLVHAPVDPQAVPSRRRRPLAVVLVAMLLAALAAPPPAEARPAHARGPKADVAPPVVECPSLVDDDTFTLERLARNMRVDAVRQTGVDGTGVDVAVIDTGVNETAGLRGRVTEGVDLSFDNPVEALRGMDLHGHGTAMASIVAARGGYSGDGIAPGARIVDVRVGAGDGSVDVSQVIAALDWVVANRDTDGRNIRVVSLAYSTDSTQPYQLDPLSRAVENAWRAGIVVVVAGGNDGRNIHRLGNPATNPYVIAVGAASARTKAFWRVADWSSSGDGVRDPDLVAPGYRVLGAGVGGSFLATHHPEATCTVGEDTYLRGSGTSQAAAAVAGAAALLLEQRPELTPDQVKHLLVSTARELRDKRTRQGAGLVDVAAAARARTPGDEAVQAHAPATGLGTLEEARGTMHVGPTGDRLTGELTAFGTAWDGPAWVAATTDGTAWSVQRDAAGERLGARWMGATWSGATWSGATWSGATWSGATWSGATWSGATWSGATWSGATWSGATWSGATWSGATWSGSGWTGAAWR